jgi:hypothetical protein
MLYGSYNLKQSKNTQILNIQKGIYTMKVFFKKIKEGGKGETKHVSFAYQHLIKEQLIDYGDVGAMTLQQKQ